MKHTLVIVILAAALTGCARHAPMPATRLSFQRFVTVMSELGTSQPHQRATILRKHKTSDAELREFIDAYARNPRRLSAAFDSVERVMERRRASYP
jgi:hypothetical protein